jgi:hypothetical protein
MENTNKETEEEKGFVCLECKWIGMNDSLICSNCGEVKE